MVNPYQSPEPIQDSAKPLSGQVMRAVRCLFCLVNLAVAGMFAASGIAAIFGAEQMSMRAISAIMFGPIFVVYAVCEALAIVRPHVERKLGYANLMCAGLVVCGMATNTYEAVSRAEIAWSFLYLFLPIAGAISLYLVSCGLVRLRIAVDK